MSDRNIPYYNASLRNLLYRLRAFKEHLPKLLEEVVRDKEGDIVALIQEQLYERGINGDGEEIMSYQPYSVYTVRRKQFLGQPTDRVTLRDTGKFYQGMHIVFDEGGFYITSSDSKTERLVSRYQPTIFRLTDENLNIMVREIIRVELQKRIKI